MKTPKKNINDIKIAVLENTINNINDTLIRFEKRFDSLEDQMRKGFEKIDEKFTKVDEKLDKINNRLWILHLWTVSGFAAILCVIAKSANWF